MSPFAVPRPPPLSPLELLLCPVVVVMRLLLAFVLAFIVYMFSIVATAAGEGQLCNAPLKGYRGWCQGVVKSLIRPLLWACGYTTIRVVGRPCLKQVAPVLLANSEGWIDVPLLWGYTGCSCILPYHLVSGPAKVVVKASQALFYDPDTASSAPSRMRKRVRAAQWPQVAVFPEGAVSNGEQLLSFGPGPFKVGAAVQPVAIKVDPPGAAFCSPDEFLGWGVLRAMSRLGSSVTLHFLDVVNPRGRTASVVSDEVRGNIGRALGVPLQPYSCRDASLCRALAGVQHFRLRPSAAAAGCAALPNGVEDETLLTLLSSWARFCHRSPDGTATRAKFEAVTGLKSGAGACDALWAWFCGVPPWGGQGASFASYVWVCLRPLSTGSYNHWAEAAALLDSDGDGVVSPGDIEIATKGAVNSDAARELLKAAGGLKWSGDIRLRDFARFLRDGYARSVHLPLAITFDIAYSSR
eukprot:Hpha_TRINITY_DN2460_c0_g1::TRINITY_DN2460_c0_g1_i1::g.24691::m.24691/K13510/LPCAT1_2; lysophosphatidylcholine acyltransferase / lyso-PAF acetyltransferase